MTDERRIRVLVVDDSAFARKVLRDVLARDPRVEVVDIARDGLEALEKIAALHPDVVTLDLLMPNLDGIGVLKALPLENPPRVLVVSFSDADTELGAEALQLGALDIIKKPTALATDRMYELAPPLLKTIRAVAEAHFPPQTRPVVPTQLPSRERVSKTELVVVGTSTGGPQALTQLMAALPADLPVPVAVALHIPAGYTEALAKRLDASSNIRVVEASDGMLLSPGTVLVAPGGLHLEIVRSPEGLRARTRALPIKPFTPSVDVLFESAAQATSGAVLGVVLTGMGDDGLEGSRKIREAGGEVLTEAPESCVIYGMPRMVAESGLSSAQAPLWRMSQAIVERL